LGGTGSNIGTVTETDVVFVFSIALAEDEGVMEKYDLPVDVFHRIFSSHRKSGMMDNNTEKGPRYWLNLSLKS
jgi:hypothetical protein